LIVDAFLRNELGHSRSFSLDTDTDTDAALRERVAVVKGSPGAENSSQT